MTDLAKKLRDFFKLLTTSALGKFVQELHA